MNNATPAVASKLVPSALQPDLTRWLFLRLLYSYRLGESAPTNPAILSYTFQSKHFRYDDLVQLANEVMKRQILIESATLTL